MRLQMVLELVDLILEISQAFTERIRQMRVVQLNTRKFFVANAPHACTELERYA